MDVVQFGPECNNKDRPTTQNIDGGKLLCKARNHRSRGISGNGSRHITLSRDKGMNPRATKVQAACFPFEKNWSSPLISPQIEPTQSLPSTVMVFFIEKRNLAPEQVAAIEASIEYYIDPEEDRRVLKKTAWVASLLPAQKKQLLAIPESMYEERLSSVIEGIEAVIKTRDEAIAKNTPFQQQIVAKNRQLTTADKNLKKVQEGRHQDREKHATELEKKESKITALDEKVKKSATKHQQETQVLQAKVEYVSEELDDKISQLSLKTEQLEAALLDDATSRDEARLSARSN
jgi:hypothetical protein